MKGAGFLTVDEAMTVAGVDSLTVAPALLHTLSKAEDSEETLAKRSLFNKKTTSQEQKGERISFIDDESKFKQAFAKSDIGKGQVKTQKVAANRILLTKAVIC